MVKLYKVKNSDKNPDINAFMNKENCPYTKEIWDAVEDMFLNRFNIPIALNKTNILFGKFNTCNMYKVENLLILVIKHYIFTCKYNSTKKLNTDALLNVITERIYVEKIPIA